MAGGENISIIWQKALEQTMGFYSVADRRTYRDPELITLRPRGPIGGCELIVFVLRDDSRVFIGGGQWGFDSQAREADELEIEALADRFGWRELHEVLSRRASVARPLNDQTPQRTDAATTTKRSWFKRLFGQCS